MCSALWAEMQFSAQKDIKTRECTYARSNKCDAMFELVEAQDTRQVADIYVPR